MALCLLFVESLCGWWLYNVCYCKIVSLRPGDDLVLESQQVVTLWSTGLWLWQETDCNPSMLFFHVGCCTSGISSKILLWLLSTRPDLITHSLLWHSRYKIATKQTWKNINLLSSQPVVTTTEPCILSWILSFSSCLTWKHTITQRERAIISVMVSVFNV